MELYIVALAIYSCLLVASFFVLKHNAKEFQKKKIEAANLIQAAENGKDNTHVVDVQQISKCTMAIYLLKNFTLLNLVSKQAHNRCQLLLLNCAFSSLYTFFLALEYPPMLLGSLLSIVLLIWERRHYGEERRLQLLVRSQIASCVCGVVEIGVFLWLISLLYKCEEDEVRGFLIRLAIALSIDNLVVKPIVLGILSCGLAKTWPLSLLIKQVKSNKLGNQFYRTSESQANMNDTLFIYKEIDQEIPKPTSLPGEAVSEEPKQTAQGPNNSIANQNIHHKLILSKQSTRKTQVQSSEEYFTVHSQTAHQTQGQVRVLSEKNQHTLNTSERFNFKPIVKISLTEAPKYQQQSCSKQNGLSEGNNVAGIKRRRRQRKVSQTHPETNRVIEIYGEGLKRSEIELKTRRRKSINRPQQHLIFAKSENGIRSRPTVHEQPDTGTCHKTNIKKFLSPEE